VKAARGIGYPLMLKAVAGGGGKGMRLVTDERDLPDALRAARSEALSAFGDASVYLERRLDRPRHIEVQLLGDAHGAVLPFVERECSIQRRHQKVLEESPSIAVTPDQRRALTDAAARVARHVGYTNAGTIEFLLDADGHFYFLEMNTRLQVEHPVTEMVTGIDLVEWQLRIAQGESLALDPEALITPRGHAIEARIYAEDPDNRFLPSPGHVTHLRPAAGPGVRDDGGLTAPGEVPIYYDPLVAKLIAWGGGRDPAIARLSRALREYEIEGIKTTIPFFRWLLTNEDYLAARVDTTWLDRVLEARTGQPFWASGEPVADLASIAAAIQACAARSAARSVPSPAAGAGWVAAARREALR
jgi:acetyl-CoA carboxylase biotin carboxylase subunit